jgi:hypothetical protein
MSSTTTDSPFLVIQQARKRPLYLANNATLDHIKWYQEGHATKLILITTVLSQHPFMLLIKSALTIIG